MGHDAEGGKITKAVIQYAHDKMSSTRRRVMMFAQNGKNFGAAAGTSRYFEYDEVTSTGSDESSDAAVVVQMTNCGHEDIVLKPPSGSEKTRRLQEEDEEHHKFVLERIRKHMPGFGGITHSRHLEVEAVDDDTSEADTEAPEIVFGAVEVTTGVYVRSWCALKRDAVLDDCTEISNCMEGQ